MQTLTDLVKKITILDAQYMVREAWKKVTHEGAPKGGLFGLVGKNSTSETVLESNTFLFHQRGLRLMSFNGL